MNRFSKTKTVLIAGSVYLFFYLPILVLIAFSFNSKAFPAPWESFTFHWYKELFAATHLWISLKNSVVLAVTATVLSLLMAMLMICLKARSRTFPRSIALFYGNLLIPETILAVGLLSLFTFCHIPLGMPTLIVSHTVIGLGFAVPILYTRYLELDKNLSEVSFDLGATPFQTFLYVTFPLLRPTLFAVGLLIFVLSFDDFVVSYFCSGSSMQTLSLHIFSMIRSGLSPTINALSTILLILSSLLVALVFTRKTKVRIFG